MTCNMGEKISLVLYTVCKNKFLIAERRVLFKNTVYRLEESNTKHAQCG